jgi:hypothetical protein
MHWDNAMTAPRKCDSETKKLAAGYREFFKISNQADFCPDFWIRWQESVPALVRMETLERPFLDHAASCKQAEPHGLQQTEGE